jgi:hypothetical protein
MHSLEIYRLGECTLRSPYRWLLASMSVDIIKCHMYNDIKTQIHIHQVFKTLSFSSIFLLAARIISSRLFCNRACLSFLLLDHACLFLTPTSDPDSDSDVLAGAADNLEARLYFVMRSG